jgi:hypothetical protein
MNPINAELNPTCRLLALLEAHHILHVSKIRDNGKTDHYRQHTYALEIITMSVDLGF